MARGRGRVMARVMARDRNRAHLGVSGGVDPPRRYVGTVRQAQELAG